LAKKPTTRYVCQNCGATYPKWNGKCEACGEWNTLVEETPEPTARKTGKLSSGRLQTVRLDGETRPPPRITTNAALFDSMSVGENVAFGIRAKHSDRNGATPSRAQALQMAGDLLKQVGLDPSVGDLSPSELSGGMQKRVGLARAIAGSPNIMFFDEPTTGLDPIMGAVIDGLIVDCVQKLGSTAIAITHDMASAQRIGNRAAMLYRGQLIWQGEASELMNSGNAMVDQFTHGRREGPITMELRK